MSTEIASDYQYSENNYQLAQALLRNVINDRQTEIVTTIDGFATTGKGTAAEALQDQFGYNQFSNGNTIRVFTWFYLAHCSDYDLEDGSFDEHIRHLSIKEVNEEGRNLLAVTYRKALLGKLDVLSDDPQNGLRSPRITEVITSISPRPAVVDQVRYRLKYRAKKSAEQKVPFVAEGRDNYFIFKDWPHALLLYLTASYEQITERAIKREESRRKKLGKSPLTREERDVAVARTHKRNTDDINQPYGYGKVLTPEEANQKPEYQVIDTTELSQEAGIFAVVIRQLLHLGITPNFDRVTTQPTE
jgi:cytidylate kinase